DYVVIMTTVASRGSVNLLTENELEQMLTLLETTGGHGYHRGVKHIPIDYPVIHDSFAGDPIHRQVFGKFQMAGRVKKQQELRKGCL
ncbi:MAG: hypothetical protein MUP22_00425, partial [Desulfobacterales bacterium]|nr:hypothetical protein [Desulfobacterales bacterium]